MLIIAMSEKSSSVMVCFIYDLTYRLRGHAVQSGNRNLFTQVY